MKETAPEQRTNLLDGSEPSDLAIVQRALDDANAFTEIVHRYEARFRRYLRRLGVRNDDDQDDLLQDIFIKIYKNLNGYDQTLQFSSWAYRIAHNEAISHHRRRSSRPEGHSVDDGDELIALESSGHSLFAELAASDDRRVILAAIERLDEKYRDVIILRYFEEKEYEEIADILRMPIGSVATRIHRGKALLKDLLPKNLI